MLVVERKHSLKKFLHPVPPVYRAASQQGTLHHIRGMQLESPMEKHPTRVLLSCKISGVPHVHAVHLKTRLIIGQFGLFLIFITHAQRKGAAYMPANGPCSEKQNIGFIL